MLGGVVEDIIPWPDGVAVAVRTAAGTDTIFAAAVVGADGVRSSLRERIAGSARPVATRRTAWRTVVAADVVRDLVAADGVGLWLGPKAHLVHYPVALGAVVNIVAVVEQVPSDDRAANTPTDGTELMGRWFRDWAPAPRALLAAAAAWQRSALATVDPGGAWVSERLALTGDAAHAMEPFLAQGAAMAIEDAAVLAAALDRATDPRAGLAAYAAARQPRVTRVWAASQAAGGWYHARGLMALARNTALRVGGAPLVLRRNDWIYRWRLGQA
jgi:salicylate hydroxylase